MGRGGRERGEGRGGMGGGGGGGSNYRLFIVFLVLLKWEVAAILRNGCGIQGQNYVA